MSAIYCQENIFIYAKNYQENPYLKYGIYVLSPDSGLGTWILDLVEVEMVAAQHGAVLLRLREAGPLGEEGVGAARVSLPHAANAGKYFMRH